MTQQPKAAPLQIPPGTPTNVAALMRQQYEESCKREGLAPADADDRPLATASLAPVPSPSPISPSLPVRVAIDPKAYIPGGSPAVDKFFALFPKITQLALYAVAGIEQIHKDASSETKTQLAQEALGLAVTGADNILTGTDAALAGVAGNLANDAITLAQNAVAAFKSAASTPTAAPAAPAASSAPAALGQAAS